MKILKIKTKYKKGIALLFSIMLSTIFLTIALGILNISVKELNFSTSTKDSDNAFYATESAIECALLNDKAGSTFFTDPNVSDVDFNCFATSVVLHARFPNFDFTVTGLGNDGNSCAKVNVFKVVDNSTDPATILSTKITSKGYNIGDSDCNYFGSNRVERELEVDY